ncbi:MAG TPA: methyltransferase domain-containing protein [Hyphomicrobiaceae bacterium]|nr:methyltransferase domain-containing protein [Hyphomicrobiaceae bacterium]
MDKVPTRASTVPSRLKAAGAEWSGRARAGLAVFAGILLVATALSSVAQEKSTKNGAYEPQVGQAGKDVVWVPTPQSLVDKMLELAKATPQDYLIDLGSGDGRTVITAAKRGLTAHGIEYNPDMVALAQKNAKAAGVSDKATFAKADIFESDFSKAQIITMFLLPWINEKLAPKLLEMPPGTRLVSNTFTMGDWQADETATVTEDCTNYCKALLWIVPAKVAGSWQLGEAELKLEQKYQMLTGTLGPTAITDGRVRGTEISFNVGDAKYTGKIDGSSMSGSVAGGRNGNWTATKK